MVQGLLCSRNAFRARQGGAALMIQFKGTSLETRLLQRRMGVRVAGEEVEFFSLTQMMTEHWRQWLGVMTSSGRVEVRASVSIAGFT